MKNTGFTLIELIAVIAIISFTITILIIKVEKNVKDADKFANDREIEAIENATILYANEFYDELTDLKEKKVLIININTLIEKGYLSNKELDSTNNDDKILIAEIDNVIKVKYTKDEKNVIFLNGPDEVSLYQNDEYKELGAKVAIPNQGLIDLNSSNISGTVNNTIKGEYYILYAYDNADTAKRKVNII